MPPLLVLNLRLDVLNRVRWLDLKGHGLAGQRLDKDMHASTETEHQVEGHEHVSIATRVALPVDTAVDVL